MTEIKLSKKTEEFLQDNNYKAVIVSLEKGCSCGGSNVTGTQVRLAKEELLDTSGYTPVPLGDFIFYLDNAFKKDMRLRVYLNEGRVDNKLEFEGLEI